MAAKRELRGIVALPDRCVFQLRGADRLRYLNGQVTQDVGKARSDAAVYACVTSAKGRLEGDVFIAPDPEGESLWVDGPGELREDLFARLEKYIIADDVEMEDVTEETRIWHVLGVAELETAGWRRRANRFGVEGWDVVVSRKGEGLPEGFPVLEIAVLEELRMAHGMGVWGKELGPEVLPQEANLQERAIDFQKGCYIGQEVISRIKSVGKVNRELRVFVVDEGGAPEEGDVLWAGEEKVGRVTSVSRKCRLSRIIGLGYVKRGYGESGAVLTCRNEETGRTCGVEIRRAPVLFGNE